MDLVEVGDAELGEYAPGPTGYNTGWVQNRRRLQRYLCPLAGWEWGVRVRGSGEKSGKKREGRWECQGLEWVDGSGKMGVARIEWVDGSGKMGVGRWEWEDRSGKMGGW